MDKKDSTPEEELFNEPESNLHKTRILIVDDEPEIREFLSYFLESKGYQIIESADGEGALRQIKLHHPDIILLDIFLPDMGGVEVLRRIREFDQDVGVIMITSLRDEEIGRHALDLGADDFILKPIDLDYLETSVIAKINSKLA
ncbi:MAG: response regulator [Candidatus Electryonea clarkiae]|nr:response regulator [Candidatus Electryonea clarkiae]